MTKKERKQSLTARGRALKKAMDGMTAALIAGEKIEEVAPPSPAIALPDPITRKWQPRSTAPGSDAGSLLEAAQKITSPTQTESGILAACPWCRAPGWSLEFTRESRRASRTNKKSPNTSAQPSDTRLDNSHHEPNHWQCYACNESGTLADWLTLVRARPKSHLVGDKAVDIDRHEREAVIALAVLKGEPLPE